MDPVGRVLIINVSNTLQQDFVHLRLDFPPEYPNTVPPDFKCGASTTLEQSKQTQLLKVCVSHSSTMQADSTPQLVKVLATHSSTIINFHIFANG